MLAEVAAALARGLQDSSKAMDAAALLRNSKVIRLQPVTATLAERAAQASGVDIGACREYLSGLDYGLSYPHLAGLTEFFRRLVAVGRVPDGELSFLGGK